MVNDFELLNEMAILQQNLLATEEEKLKDIKALLFASLISKYLPKLEQELKEQFPSIDSIGVVKHLDYSVFTYKNFPFKIEVNISLVTTIWDKQIIEYINEKKLNNGLLRYFYFYLVDERNHKYVGAV